VRGQEIVYGPYNDVVAYSQGDATIHFENNAPFATAVKLVRELEVSHYGNLAIEEHYEIVHS
jgi:oligosaccharyltransferase complex subunit alpha (ribophorin I)